MCTNHARKRNLLTSCYTARRTPTFISFQFISFKLFVPHKRPTRVYTRGEIQQLERKQKSKSASKEMLWQSKKRVQNIPAKYKNKNSKNTRHINIRVKTRLQSTKIKIPKTVAHKYTSIHKVQSARILEFVKVIGS